MRPERVIGLDLLVAVDRFSTSSIPACEVSTLEHELFDDSVEAAALVALWLCSLCQRVEVLYCTWHNISEQPDLNSTSCLSTNGDIEED